MDYQLLASAVLIPGLALTVWLGTLKFWPGVSAATKPPEQTLTLAGVQARVRVYRDLYGIPHIYAGSAQDAYFALGYVHAIDRGLQLELFRRHASGTLAEVFGKMFLDDDIFVRRLGIRRTSEAAWQSARFSSDIRAEIESYCAGVNAGFTARSMQSARSFRMLGITPAPWTPVDALVFPKYMGWDQSGTDTDVWMGLLMQKLGARIVDELFPLDRPYEISTIPGPLAAIAHAPVPGGTPRDDESSGVRSLDPGLAFELQRHIIHARFRSEFAFGSNNWVIDGTKSATGNPMLANDPHLAFSLPSIWYTAHLVAPGLNVTGVTFAGFPYVIIGHNDRIAWGLTNMQADAVDYFVEKTSPAKPYDYFYKGRWLPISRRDEEIPVRGQSPVHLEIESTIHGPLLNVHGTRVALCWTGLSPTFEAIAFQRINRSRNVSDFKTAVNDLTVPALNVIYADVDGNIAIAPHGALPIRKRGIGRVPVDGASGDYDWVGFIPRERLPFALNPAQHYLASANGRPAPVGYPYYLGWMWDASYRTRRINQLLRSHNRITIEQMKGFQLDAHDVAAERFVPILLASYDRKPFGGARVKAAIEELRPWNFEVTPESAAATIWAAWFETYRRAVWQDDFDASGVEHWAGGWGFAGSNERQPELEVLEFLTRENPDSPWFDDVRTPDKETRDDILARSFTAAIQQLVRERGEDMRGWRWGKRNILHLRSMLPEAKFDRDGLTLSGDEFTLNPGANGGEVSGGASWRMVVDLSNLEHSFGIYPGGQSEDPQSPHYTDQMKPWAEGRYLPLYFHSTPEQFKPGEIESVLIIEPRR